MTMTDMTGRGDALNGSPRIHGRIAAWLVRRWLRGVQHGGVIMRLPDGATVSANGPLPGVQAQMHIRSWRFFSRLAGGGLLGLATAWRDGLWDSPDLGAVLDFGAANEAALDAALTTPRAVQALANLRHRLNANTRRGSRRNIAFHYDLGNAFYGHWLDETMTYSAALFAGPDTGLAAAQEAKYRRIVRDLGVEAHHTVLEIGCGWGGFALFAAKETGCRLVCLTISEAQAEMARARVAAAGLSSQIEVRLEDYRAVTGAFDRIVSIEMFEAVGESNWPVYFDKVRSLLRPDGAAMLQVITIGEPWFDNYRRAADFIQTYIFPGGMLPSPARLEAAALEAGLQMDTPFWFGGDYQRTLLEWDKRFCRNWDQIRPLGFDDKFYRMWRFYFHYCAAGFREGRIDVGHFRLTPGAASVS